MKADKKFKFELDRKIQALAESKGVEFIDKKNGHIQLKGALLVNYYPHSKSKSAYVAGTKKAAKNVTSEQAVNMCFLAPVNQGETDKRSKNSRKQRRKMIDKGITVCWWCKLPLTIDTSTVEHKIPLALGGLENANNRTLACAKCNYERGYNMPELD